MSEDEQPAMGLRERKKIKTRAAIQQHALRLFRQQGYEQTTVEQIAEAAEVSPSTFFRYFPTKEDVVLNDEYDAPIIAAFHAESPDLGAIRALRNAIMKVFKTMSEEESEAQWERAKLIMSVPELRAAHLNSLAEGIQMIAQAVADRVQRDSSDLAIQALAGALMGVGISISFLWMENPALDFMTSLDEAFDFVESGFPL